MNIQNGGQKAEDSNPLTLAIREAWGKWHRMSYTDLERILEYVNADLDAGIVREQQLLDDGEGGVRVRFKKHHPDTPSYTREHVRRLGEQWALRGMLGMIRRYGWPLKPWDDHETQELIGAYVAEEYAVCYLEAWKEEGPFHKLKDLHATAARRYGPGKSAGAVRKGMERLLEQKGIEYEKRSPKALMEAIRRLDIPIVQ